ncbi:hypothetical protein HHI36_011397, partial [Cryptolaemus montrouzieri]
MKVLDIKNLKNGQAQGIDSRPFENFKQNPALMTDILCPVSIDSGRFWRLEEKVWRLDYLRK